MWLSVHWQVAGLKGQHIMVHANSYYHGSLHQLHLRIHQGGVPFNKINPDQWRFTDVESSHTLLKFNSSPLKIGHPKRKPIVFQASFFSGYVSVEDGNKPATSNSPTHYIQQISTNYTHFITWSVRQLVPSKVSEKFQTRKKKTQSHLQGLSASTSCAVFKF